MVARDKVPSGGPKSHAMSVEGWTGEDAETQRVAGACEKT